jgi:hypothetical protein
VPNARAFAAAAVIVLIPLLFWTLSGWPLRSIETATRSLRLMPPATPGTATTRFAIGSHGVPFDALFSGV